MNVGSTVTAESQVTSGKECCLGLWEPCAGPEEECQEDRGDNGPCGSSRLTLLWLWLAMDPGVGLRMIEESSSLHQGSWNYGSAVLGLSHGLAPGMLRGNSVLPAVQWPHKAQLQFSQMNSLLTHGTIPNPAPWTCEQTEKSEVSSSGDVFTEPLSFPSSPLCKATS